MSNIIIETQDLSKNFKNITAVNSLNFKVYERDIFGFLGPNGAGKSTTIRMLLTLIKPDRGNINIFGKELRSNRSSILSRIGAIVEKPDFYLYLTAYKNLEIFAKLSGAGAEKQKINQALELVGLADRSSSKVKTFSHGMKQRLGIAQALLHEPDLIILDEPTTGLDPQGMKEIRELIVYLSKEKGKTIFLSSHLLSEIQTICNRMLIIDKGTLKAEGLVSELLDSYSIKAVFNITEKEAALQALNASKWSGGLKEINGNDFSFELRDFQAAELNKFLVEKGFSINSIIPKRSLEEYFLSLMNSEEK